MDGKPRKDGVCMGYTTKTCLDYKSKYLHFPSPPSPSLSRSKMVKYRYYYLHMLLKMQKEFCQYMNYSRHIPTLARRILYANNR